MHDCLQHINGYVDFETCYLLQFLTTGQLHTVDIVTDTMASVETAYKVKSTMRQQYDKKKLLLWCTHASHMQQKADNELKKCIDS